MIKDKRGFGIGVKSEWSRGLVEGDGAGEEGVQASDGLQHYTEMESEVHVGSASFRISSIMIVAAIIFKKPTTLYSAVQSWQDSEVSSYAVCGDSA